MVDLSGNWAICPVVQPKNNKLEQNNCCNDRTFFHRIYLSQNLKLSSSVNEQSCCGSRKCSLSLVMLLKGLLLEWNFPTLGTVSTLVQSKQEQDNLPAHLLDARQQRRILKYIFYKTGKALYQSKVKNGRLTGGRWGTEAKKPSSTFLIAHLHCFPLHI